MTTTNLTQSQEYIYNRLQKGDKIEHRNKNYANGGTYFWAGSSECVRQKPFWNLMEIIYKDQSNIYEIVLEKYFIEEEKEIVEDINNVFQDANNQLNDWKLQELLAGARNPFKAKFYRLLQQGKCILTTQTILEQINVFEENPNEIAYENLELISRFKKKEFQERRELGYNQYLNTIESYREDIEWLKANEKNAKRRKEGIEKCEAEIATLEYEYENQPKIVEYILDNF